MVTDASQCNLQTSAGSKRAAEAMEGGALALQEGLEDAKRMCSLSGRILSHEEKLERR